MDKINMAWNTSLVRSQRKEYYRHLCDIADGKTNNMSAPFESSLSSRVVETTKVIFEKPETKTERDKKTAAPKTFLDELKKLKEVRDALSEPLELLHKYSADNTIIPNMSTDKLQESSQEIDKYRQKPGELGSQATFPLQTTTTIEKFTQDQLQHLQNEKTRMDEAIQMHIGRGSIPAKGVLTKMNNVLEHLTSSDEKPGCPAVLKELKQFVQTSTQIASIHENLNLEILPNKLKDISDKIQNEISNRETQKQGIKTALEDAEKQIEKYSKDIPDDISWLQYFKGLGSVKACTASFKKFDDCRQKAREALSSTGHIESTIIQELTTSTSTYREALKNLTEIIQLKDKDPEFGKRATEFSQKFQDPKPPSEKLKELKKAFTSAYIKHQLASFYKTEPDHPIVKKSLGIFHQEHAKNVLDHINQQNEDQSTFEDKVKEILPKIKDQVEQVMKIQAETMKKELLQISDRKVLFDNQRILMYKYWKCFKIEHFPEIPSPVEIKFYQKQLKQLSTIIAYYEKEKSSLNTIVETFNEWKENYTIIEALQELHQSQEQEHKPRKTMSWQIDFYLGVFKEREKVFYSHIKLCKDSILDLQVALNRCDPKELTKSERLTYSTVENPLDLEKVEKIEKILQKRYPKACERMPGIVKDLARVKVLLMNKEYCDNIMLEIHEKMILTGKPLNTILQESERENGFEEAVPVSKGLSVQEFMDIVSEQSQMIDAGATSEHGPSAHRFEWCIVNRACNQGLTDTISTKLYRSMADARFIYWKDSDHTIWNDIFDAVNELSNELSLMPKETPESIKEYAAGYSNPLFITEHLIENLPAGPFRQEIALMRLRQRHFEPKIALVWPQQQHSDSEIDSIKENRLNYVRSKINEEFASRGSIYRNMLYNIALSVGSKGIKDYTQNVERDRKKRIKTFERELEDINDFEKLEQYSSTYRLQYPTIDDLGGDYWEARNRILEENKDQMLSLADKFQKQLGQQAKLLDKTIAKRGVELFKKLYETGDNPFKYFLTKTTKGKELQDLFLGIKSYVDIDRQKDKKYIGQLQEIFEKYPEYYDFGTVDDEHVFSRSGVKKILTEYAKYFPGYILGTPIEEYLSRRWVLPILLPTGEKRHLTGEEISLREGLLHGYPFEEVKRYAELDIFEEIDKHRHQGIHLHGFSYVAFNPDSDENKAFAQKVEEAFKILKEDYLDHLKPVGWWGYD